MCAISRQRVCAVSVYCRADGFIPARACRGCKCRAPESALRATTSCAQHKSSITACKCMHCSTITDLHCQLHNSPHTVSTWHTCSVVALRCFRVLWPTKNLPTPVLCQKLSITQPLHTSLCRSISYGCQMAGLSEHASASVAELRATEPLCARTAEGSQRAGRQEEKRPATQMHYQREAVQKSPSAARPQSPCAACCSTQTRSAGRLQAADR